MKLASPAHMSYRYVDKFFGLQTQIRYITVVYNIYCLQKFFRKQNLCNNNDCCNSCIVNVGYLC